MTVDRIETLDKRRSKVFIDGDFAFVLSRGELYRYQLREGSEVSHSLYEELLWQVVGRRAREKAFSLLKLRGRTVSELKTKLQAGLFPPEVTEETIRWLKEYGYLDDDAFARNYIEIYGSRKSAPELIRDLQKKGIDRELAKYTVRTCCEPEDRREELLKLMKKRGLTEESTPRELQKTFSYLMRRGFSWEEIRAAAGSLKEFGDF